MAIDAESLRVTTRGKTQGRVVAAVGNDGPGGWRLTSGTSMASPHVAVVVAKTLRDGGVESQAQMSWLMTSAEDLGKKGFDPVCGHGLITAPTVVVSEN